MKKIIIYCIVIFYSYHLDAQTPWLDFFKPADSVNKHRILLATAFTGLTYTAFSVGLYHAWYKNYDRSSLHSHNDWGEWYHMDKLGHVYNSFFQTALIYNTSRWSGLSSSTNLWTGVGVSMLFQTTIEMMDGHSKGWGFSWPDMAANVLGIGFFISQQKIWNEQKMYLKFSAYPVIYPQLNTITKRVTHLFGINIGSKLLKDYNAQTYWFSMHPLEILNKKSNYWPAFLNIAFGYGAKGMYGAYENAWMDDEGQKINLSPLEYPRYSQYFLSLDLDLRKIPVRNNFLRSALHIINIVKFPMPALEYNSLHRVTWHWLKF
ncbi:MAG: YfiM family protein [Bacteroidota bacterium]|nr:YfiM family protein [Bacteroidota bacterium]